MQRSATLARMPMNWRYEEPYFTKNRAEGEPLGSDQSRKGIAGEQKLVAQRLQKQPRSHAPADRGSGDGSRAPNGSPVAVPHQKP